MHSYTIHIIQSWFGSPFCLLYNRFLSQTIIRTYKLNGKDTYLASLPIYNNYSHETILILLSTAHGGILLWWNWLLPAAAVSDYHITTWIIASHNLPISLRTKHPSQTTKRQAVHRKKKLTMYSYSNCIE